MSAEKEVAEVKAEKKRHSDYHQNIRHNLQKLWEFRIVEIEYLEVIG
jgi:hypothetical protein